MMRLIRDLFFIDFWDLGIWFGGVGICARDHYFHTHAWDPYFHTHACDQHACSIGRRDLAGEISVLSILLDNHSLPSGRPHQIVWGRRAPSKSAHVRVYLDTTFSRGQNLGCVNAGVVVTDFEYQQTALSHYSPHLPKKFCMNLEQIHLLPRCLSPPQWQKPV